MRLKADLKKEVLVLLEKIVNRVRDVTGKVPQAEVGVVAQRLFRLIRLAAAHWLLKPQTMSIQYNKKENLR
jgi:hypothetical protein